MWKYLCLRFPDAYKKKTKFGLVTYFNYDKNFDIQKIDILDNMMSMFSCSKKEALEVLDDWIDSRNVVHPIPNSTNPDVLVISN